LAGFVKRFYDNPDFCRKICHVCNYCEQYAMRSMDKEKTEEINRQALSYFDETDSYTKALYEENREKEKFSDSELGNETFDFE
jgi:hypothetical protein